MDKSGDKKMKQNKSKINTKQKNNFYNWLILFLVLILLVLLNLVFYINAPKFLEEKYIDVKFGVDNEIGMIIERETLDYGTIPPGGAITKRLSLENNYDFDVVVRVFVDKNLENYIFGDKEIFIAPGERVEYPLKLSVPVDSEYGNYSGRIRLETVKKRGKFLYK
jgi:hypothetical protein